MAQRPAAQRTDAPIELRVYGLEGIVSDLDTAVSQQAVTLAMHNEKLAVHDTMLAVQATHQAAVQKGLDAAVQELVKTRWTLIGGAISVALSCVGLVFGLS